MVSLRTSSARAIRPGSVAPRSDSAAICTAAGHPSVRSSSSSRRAASTSTPKLASRSRLSSREKYRSASRSSHSSPHIRSRCWRSGGSNRLDSTSCTVPAGQFSIRSIMCLPAEAAAKWKSSTTNTDPAGRAATSLAIEAVTSADITPSIASNSPASTPKPGCAARGASMSPAQNRTGSASARSQASQNVLPGGRAAAQSASSTLLPAPADPTTTVSRLPAPAASRPSSTGRRTSVDGKPGGRNFITANRAPEGAARLLVARVTVLRSACPSGTTRRCHRPPAARDALLIPRSRRPEYRASPLVGDMGGGRPRPEHLFTPRSLGGHSLRGHPRMGDDAEPGRNARWQGVHTGGLARLIPVRSQTYEITFLGQAGSTLSAEFDDCEITIGPGTTTLRADLPDQGALTGLMERITSLGLKVIDVSLVALPPGDG